MNHQVPPRKRTQRNTEARGPSPEGMPLLAVSDLPEEWRAPEPRSPRGRIMAAARALFAEKGIEATSVRDITEAADVNSAMVHYYFRSKEELYRRVLGHELLTVFRTIHAQVDPHASPAELLVSLPTHVMRVVRANPVWAKLLSREVSNGAKHLQRVVADLKEAGPLGIRTRVEAHYKQALKQKQVRELPIVNVIQFLIAIGYSGVFFNPFFQVIGGHDPNEELAFNQRVKTFDALIRHALLPDNKE